MGNTLVLYHNDEDGFCSAWVFNKFLKEGITYRSINYGDPVPSDIDSFDEVYLLDFSFKRYEVIDIAARVTKLWILDHHKTAAEELVDLSENVLAFIDQDRSGCQLTWDFMHFASPDIYSEIIPRNDRPKIVDYVADRDLWQWKLHDSELVNLWIKTLPFDFNFWDNAERELMDYYWTVLEKGAAIKDYQDKLIKRMADTAIKIKQWDLDVILANAPILQSELGEYLKHETDVVVMWWQDRGTYRHSLRSSVIDVSEIAKKYGGGGHTLAAGFEAGHFIFS